MIKNQLQQYVDIQKNNQWFRERIQELEAEAENIGARISKDLIKSTPAEHDKMARTVAKMVDFKTKLDTGELKADELLTVVEKSLSNVDPRLQYLIRRRYIDGACWEQIRDEIGVSKRQIHNLHNKALKLIC